MHVNLDPQLVDKIASEVKSQGVFDQFRKDSMADVDTKPAYQNLRQRVENTVNKFLAEQRWTPEVNKNQLRERLRKHITEAGFLDVGVERIVDQVVNPKIATVFQPKIEDIAYTYLGIPKPQPKVDVSVGLPINGILQIKTDLLPTDLEQVSPDSDKGTVKSDSKDEMETDDKMDDFESPAFEPIEISSFGRSRFGNNTPDLEEDESKGVPHTPELYALESHTPIQDESPTKDVEIEVKVEETSDSRKMEDESQANTSAEANISAEGNISGEVNISGEATQESQLSQVSSDSRLSIVTNDNTQDEQSVACENHVNISEEAQMPKFNENSNSGSEKKPSEPLHFDIKKDEIKFEGTERKTEPPTEAMSPNTSDEQPVDSSLENKSIDNSQTNDIPLPAHEYSFEKEADFKFSKIEVKVDLEEVTKTTSLDDSIDRELHIIEKSEMSQCSVSQQSMKSPTTKQEKAIKSSSATSSPSLGLKSSHRDKEHSSSRYKKHSKDRSSEKDRDRHSSGHKISSSSSSKYHSSSKSSGSHRVSSSSDRHHDHHRSSSSSYGHKSKHSSRNGKSSRSHHDSKESRSRDHSKSSSEKTKEKSSKEKSDRSKASDDHYSSKHKWRKSTDDEDSSQEGTRAGVPKDNSSSRENGANGTLNNSNTSSGTSTTNNTNTPAGGNADTQTSTANSVRQKIVILDNLLENPKTNFIEIGNAHVQINSSSQSTSRRPLDDDALYYFENDSKLKKSTTCRISTLTKMIENIRSLLHTNLDFPREQSTTDSEVNGINEGQQNQQRTESVSQSACSIKRHLESPSSSPSLTSATLTIDCIQYSNTSSTHCLSKRFKYNATTDTKVSPTPSELSVNSKENEFIDKNAQSDSEYCESQNSTKSVINKVIAVKRRSIVSQRYSSEDLYKPRPILSQRSRRRGLDAVN